ncbi:fatty acid biosynthesis transcriptional regulator FasR [Marihabitans asiaticum]|uniref:PucR-like helix-turn-helix protein n=1 Tax=Marihabitans asiaticum TaxID=415218 RepID=A0A560WAF2_9MICO|nr:helix-turn-helix domain-containing protein [Marihabitans asiaticum]TWD14608.1 PucR-like helix-turn-helix protein [Marihabitans asiaticum]
MAGSRVPARTRDAVRRRSGQLATAATRSIEQTYGWYGELTAQERSWVAQIAQAGIADFVAWMASPPDDGRHHPEAIFGAAPRALTRSISLAQTLDLVREVVDVVETHVETIARPGDVPALRDAVLRYSREVAFGAAQVYAEAAEQRGAWDARLESLVLDAVLRGEVDESIRSQATALGWSATSSVAVVVGASPAVSVDDFEGVVSGLHRSAARRGLMIIAGVQGRRLVVVLGQVNDLAGDVDSLLEHFGDGPVVHGHLVEDLVAAPLSAGAALAGHDVASGWPRCPRPVSAADLLPERALAGEEWARLELLSTVWEPLQSQPALLETAEQHLDTRSGLEGTARALFVHVNTVRYRIARIGDLTGLDLADPHDAFTVRVALTLGRLLEVSSKSTR